jgi:homoserine acetyltransferase
VAAGGSRGPTARHGRAGVASMAGQVAAMWGRRRHDTVDRAAAICGCRRHDTTGTVSWRVVQ